MTSPTVPELAAQAQAGSLSSFARLVERFEGPLFNFLLRRTSSAADAEDLTQDAFVRAWQRIDQYDPKWQFSTWLFTIAARLAITHVRRHRSERATWRLARPGSQHADDPARLVAQREQGGLLWDLADRVLSESQRAVLWLRYAEGLSVRDIAGVLGKTRIAVRVALFRARKTLMEHATEKGLGPQEAKKPSRPVRDVARVGEGLTGDVVC